MIVGLDGQKLEAEQEKPKPKPNCSKCYGRGYVGLDTKTKAEVVCPCIIKQIEKNFKKKIQRPVIGETGMTGPQDAIIPETKVE